MWCSFNLAGRLRVIPCGTTAGPLMHDNRVCVGGLTRTRHKVILRRCMCARPNPHVPMGYTPLASLYVEAVCGYGVQVIPCGVGCMLYLVGSPVGPLTKASHNGGCLKERWDVTRMAISPFINSIATAAYVLYTWSSMVGSPRSVIIRSRSAPGSLVHTARVVSGACIQIGQHPPTHTPVLLGGCPEQEPAAYDPQKINIHPASSPVHPPNPELGARPCPPGTPPRALP